MTPVSSQDLLPVHVITGFLGSGKTTLLNRLVNHPALCDSAIIINELGDIGLDHLLVDSAFEDAVLMRSGCICCTIRGDLVDTLSDLLRRRDNGDFPPFSRVLVETTGLADPAPVLQTLIGDPNVLSHYRPGGVVTLVDAVNGLAQLDEHPECPKQVAVADRLLITKVDIADTTTVDRLTERLRELNPACVPLQVTMGAIAPSLVLDAAPFDIDSKSTDVRQWLMEHAYSEGDHNGHEHEQAAVDTKGEGERGGNRHDDSIRAFCLTYDKPIIWSALNSWLGSIASLRGDDLLRVKGLVNVAGVNGPVVIQGVQRVFHPPTTLEHWPDDDHRTRIVLITRGLRLFDLTSVLDAVNAQASTPETS